MNSKEAKKRAEQIAEDLEGIAGRLPIERAVKKHQVFFQELRKTGATWGQIAKLMAGVGFRRADGTPLTEQHWSAMMSRIGRGAREHTVAAPLSKRPHEQGQRAVPQEPHQREVRKSGGSGVRELMERAKNARKTV